MKSSSGASASSFAHMLRQVPLGVPQFHAQPQLDLIAHRRLRRAANSRRQKRPVVMAPAALWSPIPSAPHGR